MTLIDQNQQKTYIVWIFALEELVEFSFRPFLVLCRQRCMPPIEEVELYGNHVAFTLWDEFVTDFAHRLREWLVRVAHDISWTYHEGIETPVGFITDEPQNCAYIISENDMHEIPTIYETGSMKYFVILRQP